MKKIETLGSQVFSVPNTEEGRLFVSLCHKYLNTLKFRIHKKKRINWVAVYPIKHSNYLIKQKIENIKNKRKCKT